MMGVTVLMAARIWTRSGEWGREREPQLALQEEHYP